MAFALGLSLDTALAFAGAAQAVASEGYVKGGMAILESVEWTKLDDPHDQEMIRLGYADATRLGEYKDPVALPTPNPSPNAPLGPPSRRRVR